MVKYPSHSSADIQAELYHQLRCRNIDVRVEVHLPSSAHRSGKMRADLVVYNDGLPAFLIECKYPSFKLEGKGGRQQRAYTEASRLYEARVMYLTKFEDAARMADEIQTAFYTTHTPHTSSYN